jgi:hypothetical protein
MTSLRQRLEEIREYKRILIEDGIKPDAEDKMLESELIQRLLGLEKDLARMDAAKGRRLQDKVKRKDPTKKTSRGMLDGVKKDLSKVKSKAQASDSEQGSREGSRSRFRTKKKPTDSLARSKTSAPRTADSRSKDPQKNGPKPEGRQSKDLRKNGPKPEGRQSKDPRKNGPKPEGRQSKDVRKNGPKPEGRQSKDPQKKLPRLNGRQNKFQPQNQDQKKTVKTNRRQPQKRA